MKNKYTIPIAILFLIIEFTSLYGGETLLIGFHANMSNWKQSELGIPANRNREISVTTGQPIYGASGIYEATPGGYIVYCTGWAGGIGSKGWVVPMTTSKYENLTLSFYQRSRVQGSEYGPRDFKLQYSTDGSNWTDVPGTNYSLTSSWQKFDFTTPLPPACNNQATLYLKLVKRSDIAIGGGAIHPDGLSDFAEFHLYGDEIPVAPSDINLSSNTVKANAASGTTIGTLTAVDENSSDTHTFTLVSGSGDTDNGSFTIAGNALKVNAALSVRSYSVRINAFDGTYNYSESFTITSDILAPTDISLNKSMVVAGSEIGTDVGTLSATDPNGGDITFTYSLVEGDGSTNNNLFTITGTSLKTNAVISLGTYSIRINVNNGYRDYAEAFTITAAPAPIIWNGTKTTFTKTNYADWTQLENQDRISSLVWITRANTKPIFNIKSESSTTGSNCSITSPEGTEWALGTTADYSTLTYNTFVNTAGCAPQTLIGLDMVLHLIEENIYIDIKFLSWTNGTDMGGLGGGGFSYERSTDPLLPVELNSFKANATNGKVELNWSTATEVNNYGFQIERLSVISNQSSVIPNNSNSEIKNPQWESVGFVEGNGNSNSPKQYSFVDENPPSGTLQYRLKQIDTDGTFEYYPTIAEVNYSLTSVEEKQIPTEFGLLQNYPNPFNPETVISYQLPVTSHAMLKVYDLLGNEVATLVNEAKSPGYYQVTFDGSNLATGVYIYKLTTGSYTSTKKINAG